jgi:hypothetical protein
MRYLMTFPISHAAIIIEVSWHTVGRPSDDCAASPVPTGLDGLLPGMEPHGTGVDTAAANLWRSGPSPAAAAAPRSTTSARINPHSRAKTHRAFVQSGFNEVLASAHVATLAPPRTSQKPPDSELPYCRIRIPSGQLPYEGPEKEPSRTGQLA